MAKLENEVSPAEQEHQRFTRFWQQLYQDKEFADNKGYLKQTAILEELARKNNTFYFLFDSKNYRIVYFSDNVESIFGYSSESLKRWNILLAFKVMDPNHLTFPMVVAKWAIEAAQHFNRLTKVPNPEVTCSFCGLKIRHKKGHYLGILVRYTPIEMGEDGFSPIGIGMVQDVSHFLKSDFYWARASFGNSGQHIACYHSLTKENLYADIISDREKDVLRLIADGLSSKEIAERLFIAQNTVDRHRKNMLARTGAKDTTALVELCRLCDIL